MILDKEKGFAKILTENLDCIRKAIPACPQKAIQEIKDKLIFAIGTDDYKNIKSNDHVGQSLYFQIFEYSEGEMALKETRENPKFKEDETKIHGDPGKAKAIASVLNGVDVLIGKIMGPNIVRMKNQFVCAVVREKEIKVAMDIIKANICAIVHEKNKKDNKEKHGIILK
jgi:predicted Fe-Mo cluster-binding NifX family protein